jgi:hypothetical protein
MSRLVSPLRKVRVALADLCVDKRDDPLPWVVTLQVTLQLLQEGLSTAHMWSLAESRQQLRDAAMGYFEQSLRPQRASCAAATPHSSASCVLAMRLLISPSVGSIYAAYADCRTCSCALLEFMRASRLAPRVSTVLASSAWASCKACTLTARLHAQRLRVSWTHPKRQVDNAHCAP